MQGAPFTCTLPMNCAGRVGAHFDDLLILPLRRLLRLDLAASTSICSRKRSQFSSSVVGLVGCRE